MPKKILGRKWLKTLNMKGVHVKPFVEYLQKLIEKFESDSSSSSSSSSSSESVPAPRVKWIVKKKIDQDFIYDESQTGFDSKPANHDKKYVPPDPSSDSSHRSTAGQVGKVDNW